MRVATDIGGTFTDLVYVDDQGYVGIAKSNTTPPNFEKGVLDVIDKAGVKTEQLSMFIHGTTVIINTLTERKGAKMGLITTKGFRDILEIARGNRPDLFNVRYKKPVPFVERHLRLEVDERLNYKGEVLSTLKREEIEACVNYFKKEGVEAIAVSYLHSYVNSSHEQETVKSSKSFGQKYSLPHQTRLQKNGASTREQIQLFSTPMCSQLRQLTLINWTRN